jgi:hypothetical protein
MFSPVELPMDGAGEPPLSMVSLTHAGITVGRLTCPIGDLASCQTGQGRNRVWHRIRPFSGVEFGIEPGSPGLNAKAEPGQSIAGERAADMQGG